MVQHRHPTGELFHALQCQNVIVKRDKGSNDHYCDDKDPWIALLLVSLLDILFNLGSGQAWSLGCLVALVGLALFIIFGSSSCLFTFVNEYPTVSISPHE